MQSKLLKLVMVLFIPGIILAFSTCSEKKENFDWLMGQWVRINNSEGQTTYEFWEKKSEVEYAGIGFTMQQSDTIWKEHIYLRAKDGNWHFKVRGMNDVEPTIFQLTSIAEKRFVVENKENEFPKKIEYQLVNHHVRAVISGGGPEILFEFEKLKP